MPYSFYRTITIDHTKCGSANSTNFPVAFFGTYTYLKTVGNGGNVTSSSGYDIVFATDNTGGTLYDFELVTYSATTGAVEFHIRIPTLSHTVDTVIYMFYGNSSVTTYQGNTNATWNSSFKGVYHFGDASSLILTDSTSNANTVSLPGANNPTATAGQVGGACVSVNTGGSTLTKTNPTGLPASAGTLTLSCWLKTSETAVEVIWGFGQATSNIEVYMAINGAAAGKASIGDVSAHGGRSTTSVNDGNWHHVVATYDGASGNKFYCDGALQDTRSQALAWSNANTQTAIFEIPNVGGTSYHYFGTLDEIRIRNDVQSTDEVTTQYNNQFDPTTFYTIGAAVPVGGGGGVGGNVLGRVINLAVRLH